MASPSDLADWMRHHSQQLGNLPLDSIILPGSHDAQTYHITGKSLSRFKGETALRWLFRACPCFIAPWTQTQDLDIRGQLDAGIRLFDFRLALHQSRKPNPRSLGPTDSPADANAAVVVYTAHTLSCVSFQEILQQVSDWLPQHPEEVVLFRLTRDWAHRMTWQPEHTTQTWQQLKTYVGAHVCSRSATPAAAAPHLLPRYNSIVSSGKRLLVLLELPIVEPQQAIQPGRVNVQADATGQTDTHVYDANNSQPTPLSTAKGTGSPTGDDAWRELLGSVWGPNFSSPFWAESDTAEGTLQGILDQISRAPMPTPTYRFAAFAVTPTASSVITDMTCHLRFSLKALARQMAGFLPQLLAADLHGKVGGVIIDYPHADSVSAIINRNLTGN